MLQKDKGDAINQASWGYLTFLWTLGGHMKDSQHRAKGAITEYTNVVFVDSD
mgnify:FL=1